MNKIYVLTSGDCDDFQVQFATADKRKAQRAAKTYGYEIKEYAEDDNSWLPFRHQIAIDQSGKIVEDRKLTGSDRMQYCRWLITTRKETHKIGDVEQEWIIPYPAYYARGKTRREALKLAKEGYLTNKDIPRFGKPYPSVAYACTPIMSVPRPSGASITGPSIMYSPATEKPLIVGHSYPEGILNEIVTDYIYNKAVTKATFIKSHVVK